MHILFTFYFVKTTWTLHYHYLSVCNSTWPFSSFLLNVNSIHASDKIVASYLVECKEYLIFLFIFFPPFFPFSYVLDASKVSASDLENIQETETPPQSPTYQKEESGGSYKASNLHIKMTSPVKDSIVHYTKNKHTVKKVIPEGPMSDTDSTPTHSSSNKKDQKKAAKHNRFSRQAGRHGAANEVDVRSSTSPAQSPDDNDVGEPAINSCYYFTGFSCWTVGMMILLPLNVYLYQSGTLVFILSISMFLFFYSFQ